MRLRRLPKSPAMEGERGRCVLGLCWEDAGCVARFRGMARPQRATRAAPAWGGLGAVAAKDGGGGSGSGLGVVEDRGGVFLPELGEQVFDGSAVQDFGEL